METGDIAVQERRESEEAKLGRGPEAPLGDFVQAHLGRVSKFADGNTRNWTIFFFFRIMAKAEIEKDAERLQNLVRLEPRAAEDRETRLRQARLEVLLSLKDPALMNAGLVAQKKLTEPDADAPSQLFRGWVSGVSDANFHTLRSAFEQFLPLRAGAANSGEEVESSTSTRENLLAQIQALVNNIYDKSADLDTKAIDDRAKMTDDDLETMVGPGSAADLIRRFLELIANPAPLANWFETFADSPGAAGLRALKGGLVGVCLYEFLRQLQPALLAASRSGSSANPRDQHALADDDLQLAVPPVVRSEHAEFSFSKRKGEMAWDPCPVNYVFTYSGLKALNLDPITLASFPDAFKQGMAARAQRLGDTGPSAPENWDGSLGLNSTDNSRSIHGYFTGGFLVGGPGMPAVSAALWRRLRHEIEAFNGILGRRGAWLRLFMNCLFRLTGIEILQIELGEDPYTVDDSGHVVRGHGDYRKEHFGFADGISQPFADLGIPLRDPPLGGGTPGPNRTWTPVAPGEIYLNEPDEDGDIAKQPISCPLRRGATFVVFRKLEQEIRQFRVFLAERRSKDKDAMRKLASEFVGRWPNGAPLVLAPDDEVDFGHHPNRVINNFLYAADDPKGEKCPLGAHIRRTNPRDIGGTNDVRRHRILRRSISYGGDLLPETSIGDGRKRGLLFIAVNSRIDLQFELIQSRWINGGEILGQAGLNRCPITGANEGGPQDAFLEAGAVAPVVGLPRFVITRGGDYFFAPGICALKAIACGCTFPVGSAAVICDGYSMGDAKTPSLFEDQDRLWEYAGMILAGQPSVIRVAMPPPNPPFDPASTPVAFVGQYLDVKKVLSTVDAAAPLIYSVAPYRVAGRRISRGHDVIEGTEPGVGSETASEHVRLHRILDAAWGILNHPRGSVYGKLDGIINRSIASALSRTAPERTIDLVNDLASTCVYAVLSQLFGIPGPNWVTELAVALPFYRQHFGELPPDWLKSVKGGPPANPGFTTLQIWSIAIVVDLVANYEQQQELMVVSDQAAREFLEYLDGLVAAARAKALAHPTRYPTPSTLVDAFVANEGTFVGGTYPSPADYYYDVTMLLMDLAASAMAFVPNVFGFVMSNLLDFGFNLHELVRILLGKPQFGSSIGRDDGLARLVYETCRVEPLLPILMRVCLQDDNLPSGGAVSAGDFVAAMVSAANMDSNAFPEPQLFSLYPFLPGPKRILDNYLLFGVVGGGRVCWGKEKLALRVIEECLKAAGRLQNLKKIAGPIGDLRAILGANIGLDVHFDGLFRPWP